MLTTHQFQEQDGDLRRVPGNVHAPGTAPAMLRTDRLRADLEAEIPGGVHEKGQVTERQERGSGILTPDDGVNDPP